MSELLDELDAETRRIDALARLAARRLNTGDYPGAIIAAYAMRNAEASHHAHMQAARQVTLDDMLDGTTES